MTRVDIFGKIIKLSGRDAGTKTTKKRQWLAWKWTEKAPRKVEKKLLTSSKACDIIKKFVRANKP